MTDPEFADATYVEPITVETLEKVIAIERPDAVLPTLGGQTALNAAVALHERACCAVQRGADRGQNRRDQGGRGPRAVQGDRHRPRRRGPGQPDLPRSGRMHPVTQDSATRSSSGRPTRSAASDPASRETRQTCAASPGPGWTRAPPRGAARAEHPGVEGVRARAHAGRQGQRGRGVLDREHRPDGRAHRRFGHRRPGHDPHRPRVPADARYGDRHHARGRRGHRRLQHPVRRRAAQRPDGRDRDEPAGLAEAARWPPRPPASRSRRSPRGWPSATPWTRSRTTSPARPRPASSPRSTTWWSRCRGSRSRSSPAPTPRSPPT